MIDTVVIRSHRHTVDQNGHVQRGVLRQHLGLRLGFCAVVFGCLLPCGLAAVGGDTHLVFLPCIQGDGGSILGGSSTGRHSHVNAEHTVFQIQPRHLAVAGELRHVVLIAQAGVCTIRVIDGDAVAVGVADRAPSGTHGLVARGGEGHGLHLAGLHGVGVSHLAGGAGVSNAQKGDFIRLHGAVPIQVLGLLAHEICGDIVAAAGSRCAGGGHGDGKGAILHDLLTHQIVRAVLFLGQIGAYHIGHAAFRVVHAAGHGVAVEVDRPQPVQFHVNSRKLGGKGQVGAVASHGLCGGSVTGSDGVIAVVAGTLPQINHGNMVASGAVRARHHTTEDIGRVGIGDVVVAVNRQPVQSHFLARRVCDLEMFLQLFLGDGGIKGHRQIGAVTFTGYIHRNCLTGAWQRRQILQDRRSLSGCCAKPLDLALPAPSGQRFPNFEGIPPPVAGGSTLGQNHPDTGVAAQQRGLTHGAHIQLHVVKRATKAIANAAADGDDRLAAYHDVHTRTQQIHTADDIPTVGELEFCADVAVATGLDIEAVLGIV